MITSINEFRNIFESKQVGIIYHYTSWTSIMQIYKDDFQLKDFTYNRGYISFSRDGIGITGQGQNSARFVLDGNKMSNYFSIIPDSISKSNGKLASDANGNPIYKTGLRKQAEERIYTKNINIKPFILSIQITKDYADFDMTDDEKEEIERSIFPRKVEIVDKFIPYKL